MKQIINVLMTKFKIFGFLRYISGKSHHPLSLFLILTIAIPAISYSAPPAPPSGLCLSPGSICIGTTSSTQSPSDINVPTDVDINNFHPGYYMFVGLDSRTVFNTIADNPNFIGVKKLYIWREIEPTKGNYDFTEIEQDLEYAQSIGKRLWIQIAYIEWNGNLSPRTPKYMWNDPIYGGGGCTGEGSVCSGPSPSGGYYGNYERTANNGGWYPLFWNDYIKERFAALYTALGQRFNKEPYFEGVAIDETTAGDGPGYTVSGLENAYKSNALAAKNAFPNKSILQHINYAAFDLTEFAAWLAENGIGIGTPDTILSGKQSLQDITYPQFLLYHDKVPVGPDVQFSNYEKINPDTGEYYTAEEILLGAISKTNPWYMFWVKRKPYFSNDVIPTINKYPQLPSAEAFYSSF